jgi:thioredoxin-dependent peroxiredoxin
MLKSGDKVPKFVVKNQDEKVVSSESLLGSKYIVFFYPKDDSPGCTKHVCSVRDVYSKFQKLGYKVFGVSPDKEAKHKKFIAKYELQYDLLADTDRAMIDAFGAWGEKLFMGKIITGVIRTTYIINEVGYITEIISKVKTKEHGKDILNLLDENEVITQNF